MPASTRPLRAIRTDRDGRRHRPPRRRKPGICRAAVEIRRAAHHGYRHHAKRPSWGRRSAWRCADSGRSRTFNISITCCTRCRPCRMTSLPCAGAPAAARRLRSSSGRAGTGWKASGIPVRRWPGILNLLKGIYICVPRDATQAAGFYNTMLQSDDSALVIEVLNAYRKKAKMPDNIGEFTNSPGGAGNHAPGDRCHGRHVRRLLRDCAGGGRAAARRGNRDGTDRCAHADSVRCARRDLRVAPEDQPDPFSG